MVEVLNARWQKGGKCVIWKEVGAKGGYGETDCEPLV
jgi:hypothetical protein